MIPFPFVRRRRYDVLRACHQATLDRLDQSLASTERLAGELTAMTARYDRLVQQMVGLKRKGFEPDTATRLRVAPPALGPEERIAMAERTAAYDPTTITSMAADIRAARPDLSEREAAAHARDLLATVDTYAP